MKRALISVSDKTNLVEFATSLSNLGYEIISTGGTKQALDKANVKNISIDEVTGFPEILDGRVKTLHPKVHGGLLYVREDNKHVEQVTDLQIQAIDLVCVNLYPFKKTIQKEGFTHDEAIENIDIGGPSMLRSAAKNYRYVTVVTDINDYDTVIAEITEHGDTLYETRERLASKVYQTTAAYDCMIADYFLKKSNIMYPDQLTMTFEKKQALRYGENPHQSASFYVESTTEYFSIANAIQLHGKELSYNNIQDANATLQILKEFSNNVCCVAVKHMNPCGVGIGDDIYQAWRKAYEADDVSIFGGIVAFNHEIDINVALELSEIFLEIVLAPSFTAQALEILERKKNIRIMTFSAKNSVKDLRQFTSVCSGMLVQQVNNAVVNEDMLQLVTKVKPTDSEINDLMFGDRVVKHVKSNAIIVVKDGQTLGIGAGQMNRVGAAKIALEQAGLKAKGAVLASDAFFPMDDTVELASECGISAIIQPGGSINDQKSIDLCDKKGMSMVFSHTRHFKH